MAEVRSPVTGIVWRVDVDNGAVVIEGGILLIVESMKMEFPVEAPGGGTVRDIAVAVGDSVREDQVLLTIN